jgi:4a-hydroxytetrahydrobiopterin dehydratase
METTQLTQKKCVPCEGGVDKLEEGQVCMLMSAIPGWTSSEDKLHRSLTFKDFIEAMAFVNRMAEVAEAEGHHPDFTVHQWNKVDVTLWTHAINGLSENDFILAAKINDLLPVG